MKLWVIIHLSSSVKFCEHCHSESTRHLIQKHLQWIEGTHWPSPSKRAFWSYTLLVDACPAQSAIVWISWIFSEDFSDIYGWWEFRFHRPSNRTCCMCKDILPLGWWYLPGSRLVRLEMVIPPVIGNPCKGYINPYAWVDDHPRLYRNIGSLDPQRTC